MSVPPPDPVAAVADAVAEYRTKGDVPILLARLHTVAQSTAASDLARAVEPFRDIPEVAGPIYEVIVAHEPENARALVILANAYWLSGRGPDVVGALASRAMAADATNRGAWHLWALTADVVRERVTRWQQVSERFPDDDLARAALADNASSLASSDDDPVALKLAVREYETLLSKAKTAQQRAALEAALGALARRETR